MCEKLCFNTSFLKTISESSKFKRSVSSQDFSAYDWEKYFEGKVFKLLKVNSEPTVADKNKAIEMYDWESNANTIISDNDHSLRPEDYKSAKGSSRDSSITDHWMSIVGRVHNEPLLEDEAVPLVASCEFPLSPLSPSPRSPASYKYRNIDFTVIEEPEWKHVSDESFVRMEQLLMSPLKRDEVPKIKRLEVLNESNLISFSPFKTHSQSDELVDLSKTKEADITGTTVSDDKYETCESSESNTEDKYLLDKTNVCFNTLEEVDECSTDSSARRSPVLNTTLASSRNTTVNDSLHFNDTLEEMEHLMKFGMNYMAPKPKTEPEVKAVSNIKNSISPTVSNKENKFRLRSPRLVPPKSSENSAFKPPNKTPTTGRSFFYPPRVQSAKITPSRLTPSRLTPSKLTPTRSASALTPSKFENILSPVQYYIKNSPVVPKIKNVSPGINLWEKQAQRAASREETTKTTSTTPLGEKAYTSSKSTKMIETPPQQRLPKNFRVGIMAESLPKPMVIRHERRERVLAPLREQNHHGAGLTKPFNVDDSYANLAMTSGDVSLCIKKPAVRTYTLK